MFVWKKDVSSLWWYNFIRSPVTFSNKGPEVGHIILQTVNYLPEKSLGDVAHGVNDASDEHVVGLVAWLEDDLDLLLKQLGLGEVLGLEAIRLRPRRHRQTFLAGLATWGLEREIQSGWENCDIILIVWMFKYKKPYHFHRIFGYEVEKLINGDF